jgi:hypothetical protein
MFPGRLKFHCLSAVAILIGAASGLCGQTQTATAAPLVAEGVGKGTIPLDGKWQFHPGDDPAWANPDFDDSQWQQLTADRPWGEQGHRNYEGYAWYRRHMAVLPASGASPDFTLLVPAIEDVYEVYWNGKLVGQLGAMPPNLRAYERVAAQAYDLGQIQNGALNGVLAVRVFKLPWGSNDDGLAGGFKGVPILGSPEAIATVQRARDFQWLRSLQFRFALTSLYALVMILSLFTWARDRSQMLLFWTASYSASLLIETPLLFLHLRIPFAMVEFLRLVNTGIREISLWFLLVWLLRLEHSRIARLLRNVAILIFAAVVPDALLLFLFPHWISTRAYEIGDAILTAIYLPPQLAVVGIVITAFVVSSRMLDPARRAVAVCAFVNSLFYFIVNSASQGSRFTHWTLSDRMEVPLFSLYGSPINFRIMVRTLLFFSIVYAAIRYALENRRRQGALEQEFQNARELQQVLIPETLPSMPGFTMTSCYKPAQEVGGDFFQIIALENGATLVVLGDVSGKGLKAAMAVSLIVGAIRTFAEFSNSPAKVLDGLNRRLDGRLNGGFATAVALRLDANGDCLVSNAGHLAPFLNDRELSLPGELPLGLVASTIYEERSFHLSESDRLALFTDGLLEARSATGELYGFDRLQSLFSDRPTAAEATRAAVDFGQDDDITVLTLTRLAAGDGSRERGTAPELASA